ncbi:nuclear transport factor 2 family protein [Nocardioides sp. Soil805]|uniref:nuclear transport factor 2 family protein n=1 Tax=Nocardioides sp. Soil805 TaxID=1736416 RepID=UPI0009EB3E25|nr:nuclear transport factor 2 family protein [Nocardioides sp. Soil805]
MDPATALARWHAVAESRDAAGLPALVAPDAVFRSPAVHTPQEGRDVVVAYLAAAFAVLGPELVYDREWQGEDSAVLEFRTEVGGLTVHGIDMITWDDDGLITDFTVMVRPAKGLQVVVEHMGAELARMLEAPGGCERPRGRGQSSTQKPRPPSIQSPKWSRYDEREPR